MLVEISESCEKAIKNDVMPMCSNCTCIGEKVCMAISIVRKVFHRLHFNEDNS